MDRTGRRELAAGAVIVLALVAAAVGSASGLLSTDGVAVVLVAAALLAGLALLDRRMQRGVRRLEERLGRRIGSATSDLARRREVDELAAAVEARADRTSDELGALAADLGTVRSELEGARSDLARVQEELQASTAALQERADRLSHDIERAVEGERRRLERRLHDERRRGVRRLEASLSLNQLLADRPALPQTTTWAASSDLLRYLHELVEVLAPGTVVECGSGVSSAVMGHAARGSGSRVVALEHDPTFADKTRRWAAGLPGGHHVRIVDAPLVPYDVDGHVFWWYERDGLAEVEVIDVLVVDGPPGSLQPLSRYPAVPLLFDRLADDVVIVLDDVDREEEARIVDRWLALLPDHLAVTLQHDKGTAVLAPSGSLAHRLE